MQNINLKRFFLYLLITSVGASALIGIGVILFGNFGEFEVKVLLTTLTVTVTSILGLACGTNLASGQNRIIPFTGIGCAVIAAILWVILIWHGTIHEDLFVKSLMTITLLAASCSHVSLITLAKLDRRFIWSRYAFHAVVWSLTAFLGFLIWNSWLHDSDATGRIIGTLSILVASLTVVTPIFHKLSTAEPDSVEIDAEIERLRSRIVELEAKKAGLNTQNADPAD